MNILLCTSEALMLTTLEYRFRKNGWKLEVAEDAETARMKINKGAPDLVVVDLSLSGYEAMEIIRFIVNEHQHAVPILAAGGLDAAPLLMDAVHRGADDFIIAPYKPDELVLRVRRLLLTNQVFDQALA